MMRLLPVTISPLPRPSTPVYFGKNSSAVTALTQKMNSKLILTAGVQKILPQPQSSPHLTFMRESDGTLIFTLRHTPVHNAPVVLYTAVFTPQDDTLTLTKITKMTGDTTVTEASADTAPQQLETLAQAMLDLFPKKAKAANAS